MRPISEASEKLRRQAQRCRRLAGAIDDDIARYALLELAVDLEKRADAAELPGQNEGMAPIIPVGRLSEQS